jgi:hypothetical protein
LPPATFCTGPNRAPAPVVAASTGKKTCSVGLLCVRTPDQATVASAFGATAIDTLPTGRSSPPPPSSSCTPGRKRLGPAGFTAA